MITALYDGYCIICQNTRRIIMALDWFNQVEFLDLHAQDAVENRYPHLDHEDLMGQIHVMADDTVYAGYYGTRRLLKAVPLGFPLWVILHLPGMTRIGKRVYGYIARNRYQINRFFGVELDECVDGTCKV